MRKGKNEEKEERSVVSFMGNPEQSQKRNNVTLTLLMSPWDSEAAENDIKS